MNNIDVDEDVNFMLNYRSRVSTCALCSLYSPKADDNYNQTPRSSRRVQKKLFTTDFNDRVGQQVNLRNENCVTKCLLNINSVKTPPMIKSPYHQPSAPTKPRRFTDKSDLKPKKLIFKDIEEPESDPIELSSTIGIKSDDKVLQEKQPYFSRGPASASTSTLNKNNERFKMKRRNINDNKENDIEFHYRDNKNLNTNNNNNKSSIKKGSTSLTQKNSNAKVGLKHLRV
ncbi:probable protein phosphatase DDB_G0282105 [Microplitis mediator]|uniref:probable protein phosphatase DDB_G0282105 n=1 Tax=Microplitis mediator TaxID=375433 RepID=UPI0025527A60|nr:probable protein phosphatase DDB_G0282105 [Microplitis mediator]